MRQCKGCPNQLPVRTGPGKPRVWCEECRPARGRPTTEPRTRTVADIGVVAAVRSTLGATIDTVDGALAMHLAAKLDREETSASGAAALAKEIASRVTAATGKPVEAGDPLDQLARKREQRAAGGA